MIIIFVLLGCNLYFTMYWTVTSVEVPTIPSCYLYSSAVLRLPLAVLVHAWL